MYNVVTSAPYPYTDNEPSAYYRKTRISDKHLMRSHGTRVLCIL